VTPKPKKKEQEFTGPLEKIAKIKQMGNDFFKLKNYTEAAMKYFEAVIELEDLAETPVSVNKK